MAFTNTRYEADSGDIHPIRLNSTRVTAAGTAPTGAITSSVKVKISKSSREYGIRPRGLRLTRTIGTAPNTFKRYTFLPILSEAVFDAQAIGEDQTKEIDGVTWIVAGKIPEDF